MEFRPVWLSDLSLSMSKLLPSTKRCKKFLRGDKDEHLNEYVLHRHRQICHSGASEHAAGRQMTKVSFDQGFIWPTFLGNVKWPRRHLANMTLGQHLPTHRAIVAQCRTLGRTLTMVPNPWSLFPWPFVVPEKLGQVSLGHLGQVSTCRNRHHCFWHNATVATWERHSRCFHAIATILSFRAWL